MNQNPNNEPPTPPPAEAPTPEHEQWHALPVTMASRSLSYQGKVLGTFGNETAMRLAATHNDEVAALKRELSAMRQERAFEFDRAEGFLLLINDCRKALGLEPGTSLILKIKELATVTAERDEAKQEAAELLDARNDLARYIGIGLKFDELKTERDTALASAESARKDGEKLRECLQDVREAVGQLVMEFDDGNIYAADYITNALTAARLTSEGGR